MYRFLRYAMILPTASLLSVGQENPPPPDPDPLFASHQSYTAAAGKGVADAGAAFAWSAAGSVSNPALLYSCRNSAAPVCRSLYAGYGRDSLYDRFNLSFGASYSRRRDAIALHCRALSSGFGLAEYDAGVTLCKRFWGKGYPQGPLDIGVNLRYAYSDWTGRGSDTVLRVRSWYAPSGHKVRPDTILFNDPRTFLRERRMHLDIGLFKPDIATRVDAGISLKNFPAYRWRSERSREIARRDTAGTIADTSIVVESSIYGKDYSAVSEFMPLEYAALSFGCNFKCSIPGGNVHLSFPVEVRGYGLFNTKMKNSFAFHGGAQAHFARNFFLRAGFQRAPGLVYADSGGGGAIVFKNISNAVFGASVMPPGLPAVIDCYFAHYEWGMTVSVDY